MRGCTGVCVSKPLPTRQSDKCRYIYMYVCIGKVVYMIEIQNFPCMNIPLSHWTLPECLVKESISLSPQESGPLNIPCYGWEIFHTRKAMSTHNGAFNGAAFAFSTGIITRGVSTKPPVSFCLSQLLHQACSVKFY